MLPLQGRDKKVNIETLVEVETKMPSNIKQFEEGDTDAEDIVNVTGRKRTKKGTNWVPPNTPCNTLSESTTKSNQFQSLLSLNMSQESSVHRSQPLQSIFADREREKNLIEKDKNQDGGDEDYKCNSLEQSHDANIEPPNSPLASLPGRTSFTDHQSKQKNRDKESNGSDDILRQSRLREIRLQLHFHLSSNNSKDRE